jgi:flagellar protein FlaG
VDITKIVTPTKVKETNINTPTVTPVQSKLDGVDIDIKEEKSKSSNGESNHPGKEGLDKKLVETQVQKFNKVLNTTNKRCEYSMHNETESFMVKVIDNETNEIIKEIPSEKMLDMVAKIEEMIGLIIDEKA